MSYRVFVRNCWKHGPHGLEPDPAARKTTIAHASTEEEARDICRVWNANHKPGRLSRKAEYERE